MQLAQQIKMRQSQSLVMTPQLQQAIKLLQMTNIELCQYLENQQSENPFLEIETSIDSKSSSGEENKNENNNTKIGDVNKPAPASAIGIMGITPKYKIMAITLKKVLIKTIFMFFGLRFSLK